MAIRRVLEELEARLEPSPQAAFRGGGKGKLEFKRYGDGGQRLKINCKTLDVPDGAVLELLCGERVIAVLQARSGRAKLDEERPTSEEVPTLAAGEVITLCHESSPLLSGRLYLD